jgi:hypothetical protein
MATSVVNNIIDTSDIRKDKIEITASLDNFSNPASYDSVISLAMRLQNLLLMESGLPGVNNMGVDIKGYLQNRADDNTISTLNTSINEQVMLYLNTPLIDSVSAEYYTDKGTGNTRIAVVAKIMDTRIYEFKTTMMDFTLEQSTSQVKSQIYM